MKSGLLICFFSIVRVCEMVGWVSFRRVVFFMIFLVFIMVVNCKRCFLFSFIVDCYIMV